MTELGYLAYLILGAMMLAVVCMCIAIVGERLAFRTFNRCVDAARKAGCEKEFMNNLFFYGDSVNVVIRRKGAREIKRVYEATVKRYQ